jgi:hypothetical protein
MVTDDHTNEAGQKHNDVANVKLNEEAIVTDKVPPDVSSGQAPLLQVSSLQVGQLLKCRCSTASSVKNPTHNRVADLC